MKVPGAPSAVPATGTAPAEQFTEAYAKYWRAITWYIRVRMEDRHGDHAEDLAQETFIRLWRHYAVKGKMRGTGTYTLLTLQASGVIAAFYEARASREQATDFGDPLNTPLTFASGTYAIGRPDAAPLVRELESAMEAMTEASKAWRDQHKAAGSIRGRIAKSTRPKSIAQLEAEYQAAVDRSERLLIVFRDTCRRVGDLRAELEGTAGPRWNASSGGPDAPDERAKTSGALKSDPTVTHCPQGHRLDLENTNFDAEGGRRCRTCKAQHERGRLNALRGKAVPAGDTR